MPKPWRLTRNAETSLAGIARWTVETFGARQAARYEEDLLAVCRGIAAGTAQTQSCRHVIDADLPAELRLARVGQHLVIFIEDAEQVVIVDFLHVRSDLPRRLGHPEGP